MRLVLLFSLLATVASAQFGPPNGGGPGQRPDGDMNERRGPPPGALSSCAGQAEGAACSFDTPRGSESGSCYDIGGRMACIPADAPRPMGRRQAMGGGMGQSRPAMGGERPSVPEPAPAATPLSAPQTPIAAAPAAAPLLAETKPAAPERAPSGPPWALMLGSFAALASLAALWKVFSAPPPTTTVYVEKPSPRGTLIPDLTATEPAPQSPRSTPQRPPAPVASDLTAALPSAPRGPAGGLLVGKDYEIRRELGAGGMGVVYEAVDLRLDRRVALKKMRPEIGLSASGKQRFLEEAKTVAKLQHKNIVTIHSIVEEDKDLYLVFEYVEGRTLDDLLAERKRLTSAEALRILAGVAAAVDFAHEHRIIHRDLKPANIMVAADGEPKVMDFGIAHQAKMTISQLTRAEAYGTLAYMPPEQELGQAVRESDVYAFAALTYESLTGLLPFPGPNFHLQKSNMSFTRPSGTFPPLDQKLDPVFERAFQVEPKKRQPTTGEFVKHLAGALAPSA